MRKPALLCSATLVATALTWALPSAVPAAAAASAPPPVTTPTTVLVENITPVGLGVLVAWEPSPPAEQVTSYTITTAASPEDTAATAACSGPFSSSSDAQSSLVRVGGLCAGVAYTASIIATNNVGNSPDGGTSAPVAVLPAQVPGTPVITGTVGRDGQAAISWVPTLDDGGSTLTGFTLTARTHLSGPTGPIVASAAPGAAARTAALTGLTNGTLYDLALTANNAIGPSVQGTSDVRPSVAYVPGPPAQLSAVPDGTGSVVLTWDPPTDNGGASVSGYEIRAQQVVQSGETTFEPAPGSTPMTIAVGPSIATYTLKDLAPSTGVFDISITALNAVGAGVVAHTPSPITPTTTVSPKTHPLSDATMAALASDVGGVLTWPAPVPTQITALQVADVIVGAPSAAAPQGLIRLIKTISIAADGQRTITTENAAVNDVFSSFSLSQSANPLAGQLPSPTVTSGNAASAATPADTAPTFTPSEPGVARLAPAMGPQDLSLSGSATLNLSTKLELGDGNGAFANIDVSVSPTISAQLDVFQNAVGWPDGYRFGVKPSVKVSATAELGLRGTYTRRIGQIRANPIVFTIGPVPVVLVPKMPVDLEVSGSVSIRTELSMEIGVEFYTDSRVGGGLHIRNTSKSTHFSGGALGPVNVKGEVKLALKPQPGLALYDVLGPVFLPSLEATAEINPFPEPGEPYFTFKVELVLEAQLKLEILGKKIGSLSQKLATITLFQVDYKDPPPALVVTPDGQKVEAGLALGLSAKNADGSAASGVTWKVEGGVTNDSISSAGVLHPSTPGGRTVRVVAIDPSGAAGYATVRVGDGFDAPGLVRAVQPFGTTNATVTWTAPTESAGSPIAGYKVVGGPNGPVNVGPSARFLTLENLRPGHYSFSVYAINGTGRTSPPGSAGLLLRPICTHTSSGASSNWDDPATWTKADPSLSPIPGSQAWVCIGSGTVSVSGARTFLGLQLDGGTLVSSGPLTVTRSAILRGTLSGGGQVNVGPGVDLEVNGLSVSDTTLTNQGTLRLESGSLYLYGSAVLDNQGLCLVDPGSGVGWDGSPAAYINNQAGATLRFLGDSTASAIVGVPLRNAGTVTSAFGVLTLQHLTLTGAARFDGQGVTQAYDLALSGTTSFTGRLTEVGEIHGSGTLTVPSGSTLTLTTAVVRASTVINNGILRLKQGATYTYDAGVIDNEATMVLEGGVSVATDGTGSLINHGTLRAVGTSAGTYISLPVTNTGSFVTSGTTLYVSRLLLGASSSYSGIGPVEASVVETGSGPSTVVGDLTITGTVSGTSPLVVASGAQVTLQSVVLNAVRIANQGNLRIRGGYGVYLTHGSAVDNAANLVLEQSSSIVHDGDAANRVVNEAGATINYEGSGGTTASITAPLSSSGAMTSPDGILTLSDLTLVGVPSFSGSVLANLIQRTGSSSTFTGVLTSQGSITGSTPLTVPVGAELVLYQSTIRGSSIVNQGTVRLRGSYAAYFAESAVLDNAATVLMENNSYGTWDGTGSLSLLNEVTGHVHYLGSPGSNAFLNVPVRDRGRVTVDSGVLSMSDLRLDGSPAFAGLGTVASSSTQVLGTQGTFSGRLSAQGPISGAPLTVPAGSQLTLSSSSLQQGATIYNRGTTRLRGANAPYFAGGSTIDNTGTLLVESGSSSSWAGGADTSSILNEDIGTVRYIGGFGSFGQLSVPLVNRGTVQVDGGQLTLYYATLLAGQVVGPGTLSLNSSSITAAITFSGNPQLVLSSITVSGALSLAGVPTASITANLTGSGASPSITLPSGSSAVFSSSSLDRIRVVNRGTTRLATSYAPYFTNGSVLDNFGTILVDPSAQLAWAGGTDTSAVVNEVGGLLRYNGSLGQTGYIGVPLTNRGTLQVDSGTLQVIGATLLSGVVTGPGTLALNNSTISAPMAFTGSPALSFSEVVLVGAVKLDGVPTTNITGSLTGTGASSSLTLPLGSVMALSSSSLSRLRLVNNGTMRLSTYYAPYFTNAAVLDNFGTVLLDSNGQIGWGGGTDTSRLINEASGTFRYVGSTQSNGGVAVPITNLGNLQVDDGTLMISQAVVNSGTVRGPGRLYLSSSTLGSAVTYLAAPLLTLANTTLNGSVSLTGATSTDITGALTLGASGGSLTVPAGSSMSLTSATLQGVRIQNNGTTRLSQAYAPYFTGGSVLDNAGLLLLDSGSYVGWVGGTDTSQLVNEAGGVLRYLGGQGSTATIAVPITNNGNLQVDGGVLGLSSLASTSGATTTVSISGPSDEDAGAITLPSGTVLRGSLILLPTGGYQPDAGSAWHVLRGTGLQGSFSDITGSRRSWSGAIDDTGFVVAVTGGVPGVPVSLAATSGAGSVNVSWSAPASNNSPISGYRVTTSPDTRSFTVPAGTTTATIRGLLNGTAYSVSVVAINATGTGDPATATATPNGCSATRFSDVASASAFCSAIAWMVAHAITNGTVVADGSIEYRPSLAVSRAAMAPFLYRVVGSPAFTPPATPSFTDVPTSNPFYAQIEWMKAAGISTGTVQPDGTRLYKPADSVTRQAMSSFLYRAGGSPVFAPPPTPSFTDVPTSSPFYAQIEWMKATGISTGTLQPDGTRRYKPTDAVTRQAMASFLNRFSVSVLGRP